MNVSLGEKWEQFVEEKLKTGDYQSASELVRDGLRLVAQRDLLAQRGAVSSFEELQDALLVGVRSGPATPMTKKDWQTLQAEVNALAKNTRG
ncbi:MAG: type II toxin-antitoxin system ParD family antitoxin [Limisphaerales bacterium]